MRHYIKILSILAIITTSINIMQADTIYTWKDQSGTTNFSQTKPDGNVNYSIVDVGKPVIIQANNNTTNTDPQSQNNQKPVDINQANYNANEYSSETRLESPMATNPDVRVTITSPSTGQSMFSKEPIIEITTNPGLNSDDKPIFIVNGSPVQATFTNGSWTIPRPNPGEIALSISGTTANGQNIVSTNSPNFFVKSGWGMQTINNSTSGGLIKPGNGGMAKMAPMAPMAPKAG
jgi:hypothetical protein